MLDLGALADEHGYAGLGTMSVSPDGALSPTPSTCPARRSGSSAWWSWLLGSWSRRASARTRGMGLARGLVYTQMDERMRPSRAMHTVGRGRGSDAVLLEEKDDAAIIDVAATKGRRWLDQLKHSDELRGVAARNSEPSAACGRPLVAPRELGAPTLWSGSPTTAGCC